MILLRIILILLLACLSNAFFIEMEDTATQRSAHVYGVIRLGHYHLDNKPALVIEGIAIEEMVGTPYFSVDDIDIMHEIEHNLYRFEPENMKPIEQPDKGRTMVVLTYQSKNKPNMIYGFHFSPQQEVQISAIRQYIKAHQVVQKSNDLFAELPEELRQKLMKEQKDAEEQVRKMRQFVESDEQIQL